MANKVKHIEPVKRKLDVNNSKSPKRDVVLGKELPTAQHPVFSFEDFKMYSIKIEDEFNNYYKDKDTYVNVVSNLFGRGLQLLSHESIKELIEDKKKQNALHFHPVTGKEDIITDILRAYDYSQEKIDNILEGGKLYQFEIPYENKASRVVLQVIENIFSLLFIDANHHIYFNEKKVKSTHSLFYDECPINQGGQCYRMDYIGTCFAFECLDEKKVKDSFSCFYEPSIK